MKNKRKKRNQNSSFIKLLLVIVVVSILFYYGCSLAMEQSLVVSLANQFTSFQSTESTFIDVEVDFIDVDNFLQLINSEHPINNDFYEFETISAFKVVPVLSSSVHMHPRVLESVVNLFNDAKGAGFENFLINFGYRSYDEQRQLYDNAVDRSFIVKPGHSEHHTGLAVDIAYVGLSGDQLGKSREGKWLSKNSWKHGLILRYPEDKVDITKIPFEPWHFRYVGFPHAYYMYKNNFVFEEYIEYLRYNGEYRVELNGINYFVFYQVPQNGIITVPRYLEYEISSDNTGGFILTVKED